MNKYQRMQELGLLPTKTKVATYIDNNRAESREEHNKRMEAYDLGKEPIKKHHPDFYKESKVSVKDALWEARIWAFIRGENNKTLKEFNYLYCDMK